MSYVVIWLYTELKCHHIKYLKPWKNVIFPPSLVATVVSIFLLEFLQVTYFIQANTGFKVQ